MPEKKMTVVGFGNSITLAGEVPDEKKWLTLLKKMLTDRYPQIAWTMINSGVGGHTSREGLARFQKDVLDHRPNVVLVEFGGNDATPEPARHVSLQEFEANLNTITKGIQNIPAKPVMLVFPPIINDWHIWNKDPHFQKWNGPDACVEEYRKITRRFAGQEKLPLADIDSALRNACQTMGAGKIILPCGVHLTETGNQVVAEIVLNVMTSFI